MTNESNQKSRIPISLGIYPTIQNKLLTLIAVACALPSLILGAYSFYLNYYVITLSEKLNKIEVVDKIYTVSILVGVIYCLTVVFVFLISLIFCHRLVGPLDRLKSELNKMVDREDIHLLRVRDQDYLRSFFETLNNVLVNLVWKPQQEESDD